VKPTRDIDRPTGEYRTRYLKLRSVLYDRTTGLPAYPALLDQLRALLDDRRQLGVLQLRIDNLDLVESLYGWQVFDRVRSHAASVLREAVGRDLPKATLLGQGGVADDRFLAFIPEQGDGSEIVRDYLSERGQIVATLLEGAFRAEGFEGLSPKLSFRVGHALLSQNPFYRFERRVHAALEEAETYDERRQQRRESSWSEELQRIISDESVRTVFQPVLDLRTQVVIGYEAFARGPEDSLFETPQALFAMSRRVGVAADLDRICRESALRAAALMGQQGKLFLNALPFDAADERWQQQRLTELLETLSLDSGDLVLEFSERAAEADPDRFVQTLTGLKDRGLGVALDDIGTGFASQAILERVKPDYLKLDLSLVRNIHENLIKQEVLLSLIRIADRIEAAVIAEGIESQAEADALCDAGAQYGQGYLFAMPAPADEVFIAGEPGEIDH
jgi:EAL domain-containing protein (putative c-di-GMP-specific phosphodiesterase class I)